MMLKNFMEEKQLDYNQPFLTARRFSIDNEENKRSDNSRFSTLPSLPSYKSDLNSGPVRTAGTVPFVWEQSPGRPKYENTSRTQAVAAPKLPPGRIVKINARKPEKLAKNLKENEVKNEIKWVSSKNGNEEKGSLSSENGDNETYMDAPDTFSLSESIFLNCSESGVSGIDGSDEKLCKSFITDSQTRNFMMNRFIPAAKAIASETPQYASKRTVIPKKIASTNKTPLVSVSRPDNPVPHTQQNYGGEEESESDDDSEFGDHENVSGKLCGVLPRFCLKNPFLVMNPVPSMRIGSQIPPATSVRKVRAKSSYTGACSETKNEVLSGGGGLQNPRVHKDNNNTLKDESDHVKYQNNHRQHDGSSLYKRLQGGDFSQSITHEDKGYYGNSKEASDKGLNRFRELLANQNTDYESGSASPMVEKTLYVDSVHALASPNSSSSSDMKGLIDTRENKSESPLKSKENEKFTLFDSSLQETKHKHVRFSDQTLDIIESNQEEEDQDVIMHSMIFEGVKKSENKDIHGKITKMPLNPPLPKSPSESWLNRTLPSRNRSSRPFVGVHANHRPQVTNITAGKTYNSPRMDLHFPKDSLMPIPEI